MKEQVEHICLKYKIILDARKCIPIRNIEACTIEGRLNHIRWMCEEVPCMVEHNIEKAMRWIGFMQGVIVMANIMTIEDMKNDNR